MTETPAAPADPLLQIGPRDLPALRREMIEYLRSPTAQWMQRELIQLGSQGLGPWGVRDPAMQAALLVRDELARWEAADLYYVAPEMVDVALGAHATMPDFAPTAEDFPSPAGVMWFGKPLAGRDMSLDDEQAARLTFAGRGDVAEKFMADHSHVEIVCVAWGPFAGGVLWGGSDLAGPGWCSDWSASGGVWIHFYTLAASTVYLNNEAERERYRSMGFPRLNSENDCAFTLKPPEEAMPPGKSETDYMLGSHLVGTTAEWSRMVLATFLMMRQPMTATEAVRAPRPERRRQERAGIPVSQDVQLIQVRRPERTAEATADGLPDGHATRNWQHSWIVRGFWRNQWYPSQGRHHPRWIAPYVKGPADKPLKGAEKVNVWTR